MPQKKRKQNVAKGAKTSVIPPFQRAGVAGVGIPYHAELDPLKVLCQEDPNLEWLRKERALIAISYARGLEMWLVKARNAAFENRDLANTCGFMTLLCETEKEAEYYNKVTQSLFHHVPHSLEDDLDFKDENQCDTCTIMPNPDINVSCEEARESMDLKTEDTPRARKKLKRGFSFTKMFSRLRRSVSRRGGLNSHMSTSRSRDAMLLETDTGGLEISSHQASRKTSISRSENCLNRYGLDTTFSQDTKQTVDDTVLLSPGYCRSPIHFSFSEIWPIQEEEERISDQLHNIEVAVEVNKAPLNLLSTGSKGSGESAKMQMQSASGNLTHQNSGLEFVENDFKTVDVMTFEIPNSMKTQVELHVLLQTCSTDSDHELRDFLAGEDKWEGFEPEERTSSSDCCFSEDDADCDPSQMSKQKNPFLPHYSVYL